MGEKAMQIVLELLWRQLSMLNTVEKVICGLVVLLNIYWRSYSEMMYPNVVFVVVIVKKKYCT